jgi:hypothetical protein
MLALCCVIRFTALANAAASANTTAQITPCPVLLTARRPSAAITLQVHADIGLAQRSRSWLIDGCGGGTSSPVHRLITIQCGAGGAVHRPHGVKCGRHARGLTAVSALTPLARDVPCWVLHLVSGKHVPRLRGRREQLRSLGVKEVAKARPDLAECQS